MSTKLVAPLLLALCLLAQPATARVLSYSPYTNRTAVRAVHERTTRYFLLREGNWDDSGDVDGQVVLYDSSGKEEPRVVFPQSGEAMTTFAALYQDHPDADPVLLIGTYGQVAGYYYPSAVTMISIDGGRTWRRIPELDGYWFMENEGPDRGGPWTNGLASSIRIGSSAWPFTVAYLYYNRTTTSWRWEVLAIPRSGKPKLLTPREIKDGWNNVEVIVGQDRAGTRFVIRSASNQLKLVTTDGASMDLGEADPDSWYCGWITNDGSIYLVRRRPEGSFLYLWRNGAQQFVLGSFDTPPPENGSRPTRWGAPGSFFAVPTHDFNGAWIIQRDPRMPTTLSRHAPGGAVEKQWADSSGPDVEALHAGSSGERLLIQVHRERFLPDDNTFIDPALAVWRVGEPAPQAYDELFVNEGPTKGFVHLDVETMESGEPFVFDSAFLREGSYPETPPVSSPPPASGGGDVVQESGVVQASLKQRLVLPGVARLPGAHGSFWLTDVIIYNPLDESQDVEVHFSSLGGEARPAPVTLMLAPREIRVVEDALGTLFGMSSGGGALELLPAQAVNVSARTYSKAASGGGTFGFGMTATDFFNAAGPRFPLSFAGAFPGASFRTNVFLTDTSGRGTEARLIHAGQPTVSSAEQQTPANGVSQLNGVETLLGVTPRSTGLFIQPSRGTAIATVVAIDNRTNDPTWFPPDLPVPAPRTIPVIGHLDGANGSRFRSDLYLLNAASTYRTVTLQATSWDGEMITKSVRILLSPFESRVIEDVLFTQFQWEGVARLRYWAEEGDVDTGLRVTSRTYSVGSDGGTYGCLIPPLNNFQIAAPGDTLEIIGIVGGAGFRVNLGLVELTSDWSFWTTPVRVSIIDDRGQVLDAFTVELKKGAGMQINDLFADRGLLPPRAARIVLEVMGQSATLVGAYATLTDNLTNDSTFLGANLGAGRE